MQTVVLGLAALRSPGGQLAGGRRLAAGGDLRRALGLLTAAFGAGQIVGPALAGVLPSLLAAGALLAAAATVIRWRSRAEAVGCPLRGSSREFAHHSDQV